MVDVYAKPRLKDMLVGAGEPPISWFDDTYRWLGFRVIDEWWADCQYPTRFKWSYLAKEDKTPDDYWKRYRVCRRELEDSIEGLQLWWHCWMGDGKPWEEVKRDLEVAIR